MMCSNNTKEAISILQDALLRHDQRHPQGVNGCMVCDVIHDSLRPPTAEAVGHVIAEWSSKQMEVSEQPQHEPDCDDKDYIEARFCECRVPSGRDDPTSISNLMAEGPPREEKP